MDRKIVEVGNTESFPVIAAIFGFVAYRNRAGVPIHGKSAWLFVIEVVTDNAQGLRYRLGIGHRDGLASFAPVPNFKARDRFEVKSQGGFAFVGG